MEEAVLLAMTRINQSPHLAWYRVVAVFPLWQHSSHDPGWKTSPLDEPSPIWIGRHLRGRQAEKLTVQAQFDLLFLLEYMYDLDNYRWYRWRNLSCQ